MVRSFDKILFGVRHLLFFDIGAGGKFLIASWDAIFAEGSFYSGLERTIVKSSASGFSCAQECELLAHAMSPSP